MTSMARARELALALPEVTEQDHRGRVSFRVAGKIFATIWDDTQWNVMLDEAGVHSAVARRPESCAEVWWGKTLRAVRVQLSGMPEPALRELLTDAWEQKAPPRKAT